MGQRIDAVAHLHISSDRADERVCEMTDQFFDRVVGEDGVGIEGDDDLARCDGDSQIERGCFAAVRLDQQRQSVAEMLAHLSRGVVR